MATSVVDSGLVKGILDLATGFLQLANTPIGTFVTQAALLGGVLWGGAGLIKAANILPNLFGGIASGAGALSKVGGALNGVLGLSAGKFLLIAGAIAAVVAVAPSIYDFFRKMIDEGYAAEQAISDYNEELQVNKDRLAELEKIPFYRRTDEINDEIAALRDRNKELEKGIALKQQEAKDANFSDKYSGDKEISGFNIKFGDRDGFGDYIYEELDGIWSSPKPAFVQNAEQALNTLQELGLESSTSIGTAMTLAAGDAEKALEKLGYSLETGTEKISQKDYYGNLVKDIEDMNTAFFKNKGVVDQDFINRYSQLSGELKTLRQDMDGVSESEIEPWMEEVVNKFSGLIDATPELQDAFYNVGDTIAELNDNIPITAGQFEQLERQFPEIADLLDETSEGWVVSADKMEEFARATGEVNQTVADLTGGLGINATQFAVLNALYPQAASLLKETGGAYTLASEDVAAFLAALNPVGEVAGTAGEGAQSLGDSASDATGKVEGLNTANNNAVGKANNAAGALNNEASAVSGLGSATSATVRTVTSGQANISAVTLSESSRRRTAISTEKSLVSQLIDKYTELNNMPKPVVGRSAPEPMGRSAFPRGISFFATEEQLDDQTDVFKEQIEIMEHRLFLMEKEGKSENERIAQIRKIQAELEKQKQWYYSQGLDANSEYIRDLEKQWWGFEDDIKDLYKDQAEVYETLFSAVSDRAKEEIQALKDKKDKIKEENEALEEQIQKQEKLDALAKAKQQKILVYKDGKMQYVSDVDEVSKAQQDLDKFEREEALNEQLEAIDKEIDKWEEIADKWGSIPKEYKKFQDRLMLEQKLGIKLEGENWEKRLGNLQDYVNKYNELMSKANSVGKVENAVVKPFVPKSAFGPNAANASSGIRLKASNSMPTTYSFNSNLVRSMNNAPLPSSFGIKDFSSKMQQVINIAIDKFNPNLPNVFDGEGFAEYMRNNFWRETLHYVKA